MLSRGQVGEEEGVPPLGRALGTVPLAASPVYSIQPHTAGSVRNARQGGGARARLA